MAQKKSIRVEANPNVLKDMRQFTAACARSAGFDERESAGIVLAVDEAASNIIQHGYNGKPGWIEIEVEISEGLVVRLIDQAAPFDPCTVPEPNLALPLSRRPVGKLGVYLMRKNVDQVRHRPLPDGGNELTLIKRSLR